MYGHRFINIETEEEDNMEDNQFASTIGALFQGMDEFVTTKTVVGEPVTVGDAIILPLVDVTCGMAAGGVLNSWETVVTKSFRSDSMLFNSCTIRLKLLVSSQIACKDFESGT